MFLDMDGKPRYKIALHNHTLCSDGRVSPEEAAAKYRAAGFDAMALTDHWRYHGEDSIGGLKILSGAEYNLGDNRTDVRTMHIVGVGMKHDPGCTPDMPPQTVIDRINAAGGIAVLAHPCWSLNRPEEIAALHGFAATEIYNTVSGVHESFRPYSGNFVDLLANLGVTLPLVAADDVHYYDGTDETRAYIMLRADSTDTGVWLDTIRRGDFYATQGPQLLVRRTDNCLTVDCSPCDTITFISNMAWKGGRVFRGRELTHASYTVSEGEKWVRVEITAGNDAAWSNLMLF